MRSFDSSVSAVLIRFYLMMAVVIGGLFIGQPWIALFALPIFLSALLGVRFRPASTTSAPAKTIELDENITVETRRAA